CRTEGAYRPGAGAADGPADLERFREPPGRKRKALTTALADLGSDDGPVDLPGQGWAWAYALRSLGGQWGWLVVGAAAEPTSDEQFLLKILAHQTGSALE